MIPLSNKHVLETYDERGSFYIPYSNGQDPDSVMLHYKRLIDWKLLLCDRDTGKLCPAEKIIPKIMVLLDCRQIILYLTEQSYFSILFLIDSMR